MSRSRSGLKKPPDRGSHAPPRRVPSAIPRAVPPTAPTPAPPRQPPAAPPPPRSATMPPAPAPTVPAPPPAARAPPPCKEGVVEQPQPPTRPAYHPRDPRRRLPSDDLSATGGDEKRPRQGPSPPQPAGPSAPRAARLPPRPPSAMDSDDESEVEDPSPPASPPPSYPSAYSATGSTSYASVAAFQDPVSGPVPSPPQTSPPKPSPPTFPPPPAATTTDAERRAYPPIVVETLPNWVSHFQQLHRSLGHPPNARPFGRGIRFLPKSGEEFRKVQDYLVAAEKEDPAITWFCYSPDHERPTKVAIRGLPADTDPALIQQALCELGFRATHVRAVRAKRDRPGCLFFVQMENTKAADLQRLYATDELLAMPGVTVEGWLPRKGPAQCHRCQAFGHSSVNCHRPRKCVRCAGDHPGSLCTRDRTLPPTCANCAKAHTANDRRCKVFLREARKRGIAVPPPLPGVQAPARTRMKPPPLPPSADMPEAPTGPTLAPPANPPTERGAPVAPAAPKKKRRRRRRRPTEAAPAAASTPTPIARPIYPPPPPPPRLQEASHAPATHPPQHRPRRPQGHTLTPATTPVIPLDAVIRTLHQICLQIGAGEDPSVAVMTGMTQLMADATYVAVATTTTTTGPPLAPPPQTSSFYHR